MLEKKHSIDGTFFSETVPIYYITCVILISWQNLNNYYKMAAVGRVYCVNPVVCTLS